jgi:hypothetical protein
MVIMGEVDSLPISIFTACSMEMVADEYAGVESKIL